MEHIELHRFVLRYAQGRLRRPKELHRLMHSLERFGQISPVVAVAGQGSEVVLIDGYLRLEALRRLGTETALAEIWPCTEEEALIRVLAGSQQRSWEAIEQASLIQQLQLSFQWSLSEIARRIGRDVSWVTRRVALIEALGERLVDAVCQGHISSWAASRIIAPLARANAAHAQQLLSCLLSEPLCTRDLAELWRHYQRSNSQRRQKMIQQPGLFLKALRAQQQQADARALGEGPEGRWLKELKMLKAVVLRLQRELPVVIPPGPSYPFLQAVEELLGALLALKEDIGRIQGHDLQADTRCHPEPAPEGRGASPDKPPSEGLKKHRPRSHSRPPAAAGFSEAPAS